MPFFRPSILDAEIEEVVKCLRSGWLTTGPITRQFENDFREHVGAKYAIAVNSGTAAMHLAVEALGLNAGQAVLVPTMTFAATAEVVQHQGAIPILVDCRPETLNIDLADAERKIDQLNDGCLPLGNDSKITSAFSHPAPIPVPFGEREQGEVLIEPSLDGQLIVRGILPVHVGGLMADLDEIKGFAEKNGLWIVDDAAHAFPAAFQGDGKLNWQKAGENTADVTCFSFYANKTITTGEGGMAVTNDQRLAERMRSMSLHGLSRNAWNRFETGASWDYRIIAPGFKYNLTDIAAAIGIHQLKRAEEMRLAREAVAKFYLERLADVEEIELPPNPSNRIHSWHLFPIRLHLDNLTIDRNEFMIELNNRGISTSVHWRPLHLHPYYQETFGWKEDDFPVATREWKRLISMPIFPDMRQDEMAYVAEQVEAICREKRRE